MEQDEIALPLARADMVERERVEPFGEPGQLVIMRREQATAAIDVVHRLDDRPGDGETIICGRAAPDLVENDEAVLGRLGEDRRRLDHLHHEG